MTTFEIVFTFVLYFFWTLKSHVVNMWSHMCQLRARFTELLSGFTKDS